MKHRKLRIAWSVAWGVVVLLLVGLWLRSYWRADLLGGYSPSTFIFGAGSRQGTLGAEWQPDAASFLRIRQWKTISLPLGTAPAVQFYCHRTPQGTITISVPIWFPVCLLVLVASLPWMPWPSHFSLRSLLLATTLVALVLARLVMALR
jgi:hypothetical protein